MKLVSTTNANGKVFIVKMLETLIIMMQISALTFNCNGSGSGKHKMHEGMDTEG